MSRSFLQPSRLALPLAAALPAFALAAPASTSPYRTDVQNSHVEEASSQGIAQANRMTAVMSRMRLDYCGKAAGVSGCLMNGFLEGSTSGINYFEIGMDGGNGGMSTTALRLTATSTDSGSGALNMSQGGQQIAYSFAYNDSYFRRS